MRSKRILSLAVPAAFSAIAFVCFFARYDHVDFSLSPTIIKEMMFTSFLAVLLSPLMRRLALVSSGLILEFELSDAKIGSLSIRRFCYLDSPIRFQYPAEPRRGLSVGFHIPESIPGRDLSRSYERVVVIGIATSLLTSGVVAFLGLSGMFSSNLVSLALVIIGLSGLLREWFDFHPPSQKELSGDAAILWAVQSHPHELLEGLRVANASHEVWQALKMPRRLYLTSPVLSSVVQSKQFIDKKNVWNALGHDWIMFDLFNFWSSVDKGDFQGASRFGEILSVSVESALTKGKQLDMCFLASSLAHIVFLARENGPEEYPVQWTAFAFLDFSTIESRWRRLAESIRANLELDSEHTRDLLQEIAADFHSEGQAIDAAIAELAKSLLKELDSK